MPKVNSVILINQLNAQLYQNYAIDNLNTIDMTNDIGIAVKSSHICYSSAYPTDGTFVYVNGDSLGLIKGQDENAFHECAGVMGSYYYQNNTLYGLSDDTANYTMHDSDGLANIQPSLNASNSFELFLEYENPNSGYTSNPFFSFYLAYSTPCDTFEVTISEDTEICVDSSVQLEATGGIDYEWEPATGLSCTDCPNPVATPQESTTYTVRIFNTEECSKVLPVRVQVVDPAPESVSISPSQCGESTGRVEVNMPEVIWDEQLPFSFTLNADTQESNIFNQLGTGSYTLAVQDAYGCTWDTTVVVPENEPHTTAETWLIPEEGFAPLEVIFSAGKSKNATDFIWVVDGGGTIESDYFSQVFEEGGVYPVTLIAYNNEPHCADTAYGEIVVHPKFFIYLPNIFSPNSDGVNDLLTAKVVSAASVRWEVFNRWGNLLYEKEQEINEVEQLVVLWDGYSSDGQPAPEGVYFITLVITDKHGQLHKEQMSVSLVR
jgi:gliding motility-associated-like protein